MPDPTPGAASADPNAVAPSTTPPGAAAPAAGASAVPQVGGNGQGAAVVPGGAPAAPSPAALPASAAIDWRADVERKIKEANLDANTQEIKEFASRLASPADAVKIALDFRKANSSMVRVPGEKATPEDVQKFRKAIGVPDKPEEYRADLGRDITDADRPVLDAVARIMHQHGVPAQAYTAVSRAVTELAIAQQNELERVAVKARDDNAAALKKEWGADYAANLTLAQRALKAFGGEEIEALLNTAVNGAKLGDNPALIKAFGNIGRRMGEGEFIGAVGVGERASIQERIDRILRDNPPGTEKYKALDVQRELSELYERMVGSGPRIALQ